jgi:DNA-binding transcriptional LysR family regulator
MDLELRELRYLIAVAEERSFTAAARRLQMAQPPLSAAIKSLENWLGLPVFERTTRNVHLTPAGEALLDDARRIVADLDASVARARAAAKGPPATLDVGFRPATSIPLLNPVVAEYRRRFPGVDLRLHHVEWLQQTEWLLDGRIDISFVLEPLQHPQIEVRSLMTARRVAAVASDHPLAQHAEVRIADLADYAVAYPAGAPADWAAFWTASPRPLSPGVADPGVPVTTSDESMSVILTGGVVIAVETVRSFYETLDVVFVPIVDIEPASIAVAWLRSGRSEAVSAFVDTSSRAAAALVDAG